MRDDEFCWYTDYGTSPSTVFLREPCDIDIAPLFLACVGEELKKICIVALVVSVFAVVPNILSANWLKHNEARHLVSRVLFVVVV